MMILHFLLVVFVVLLGNFQIVCSENESLSAHKETSHEALEVELNQVKPLSDSAYDETNRGKSDVKKETTDTIKVTDLLHDPLNIINRINKTNSIHSHSITSEDFALVTSSNNIAFKDKSPAVPNLEGNKNEDGLSVLIAPVVDYKMPPVNNGDVAEVSVHDTVNGTVINTTGLNSSNAATDSTRNDSSSVVMTLSQPELHPNTSSNPSEAPYQVLNFTEVVKKVKNEIKLYSNDAVIAWEDIKERVSSGSEVSHVLEDYHDKIRISQLVNRSECVVDHVEKYERRRKFMNDVMKSCEATLTRRQWNVLQNRTKYVLNVINGIVQETNLAKETLQQNAGVSYAYIDAIEREGKEKLKSLGIESEKQTLSDLKKTALETDEDEYRDCITRNTGQEIIVDTLNDIMKIKNNCVG